MFEKPEEEYRTQTTSFNLPAWDKSLAEQAAEETGRSIEFVEATSQSGDPISGYVGVELETKTDTGDFFSVLNKLRNEN